LEHAIHHLIEHRLDLSVFFPFYQNDATGRCAYHPAILLKIVLFDCSKGITSSWEIHWNCQNNITFMALACGKVPHFTTIAAFISGHAQQVEAIFDKCYLFLVRTVCWGKICSLLMDVKHRQTLPRNGQVPLETCEKRPDA
jgi:hypothetical protein